MVNYGLKVSDSEVKVPLKNISVKVNVKGFVANVENKLKYKNDEDNPIEAIFVFPLDELSAIYRFEAIIKGRLIIGECQDKDQAQQTYQDALDAGESAFLLKESDASGDVFECFVGNIPPKTEVDITFAYAIELAIQHDGSVQFVYPAVLGPRYGAPVETDASSSAVTDQKKSGPGRLKTGKGPALKYGNKEDLGYTFNFAANIETTFGLFTATLDDGPNRGGYTLYRDNDNVQLWHLDMVADQYDYKFDHDITLNIKEHSSNPKVIVGAADPTKDGILKKDVAMVNFSPKFDLNDQTRPTEKGEFIFIVDRSGSMGADRIEYAKEALGKFLEILPEDSYFNIISFGSHFDAIFKNGSKKNTKANMKAAKALQGELYANYGGTEMLEPFKAMYTWKHIDGYQRQVFLLTDGCIWNTPTLISLVKKNAGNTRVFTFGIGHGASTSLVKGVARAGRGKAEFITDNVKELPEKVAYILSRAQQPFVSDVSLTWKTPRKTLTVTTLPQHLPPIFFGEKIIVYGVINGEYKTPQYCTAILEGKLGKKKLKYSLDFTVGSSPAGDTGKSAEAESADRDEAMCIHRLAAKAQIKELEDDDAMKNKNTIILLSTSANIMSKYTAFVGVDHGRQDKITGEMESRDVPLAQVEAKQRRKERPAVDAGPSFYGGGSTDCPLIDKYINGKVVPAIPDPLDVIDKIQAATDTSMECPVAVSPDIEDTQRELQDGSEDDPDTEGQPRKKRTKLTRTKKHKPTIPLALLQYAPWTDGCYYPIESVKPLTGKGNTRNTCNVRFCDGRRRVVQTKRLVSAAKFSAGDEVLAKVGANRYKFFLVLEYCPFDDGLILASKDGLVSRFQAHYLAFPRETAIKIKSRQASSFDPLSLCNIKMPETWGQQQLHITTSDLAELNLDGWINKEIVKFCLAHKWKCELGDGVRESVSFLSPEFYHELSKDVSGNKKCTRQSEREARLKTCRIWTEAILDIKSKSWLFIPIFDYVHWYVIAIRISHDENEPDAGLKLRYIVMDSYFSADRAFEIMLIHNFLKEVCLEQGVAVDPKFRTTYPSVPVQENLSDCGICMLLCIDKCFEDDLDPAPHMKWWESEEPDRKRQSIAQTVMSMWEKQKS